LEGRFIRALTDLPPVIINTITTPGWKKYLAKQKCGGQQEGETLLTNEANPMVRP
jgi:hypothetical protein